MKKINLNNKGYMLVEIILASVIAMSIAYYLLNLTYKFKDKNEDVYYSTELISLKNNITKNIMNDLEGKKIVSLSDPEKKDNSIEINLSILGSGSNIENKKILITKQDEKTILYYGNYSGSNFKNDSSYYKKQLPQNVDISEITTNVYNDGTSLSLEIPITSLYEKRNYNVNLFFEIEKMPILQNVYNDYSKKIWEYKDKITKIVFENKIKPPEVFVYEFDVSKFNNKSVMAYLVNNDDDTYTAYIQGDGEIIANENSSYLFKNFNNLKSIDNLSLLNTSNVSRMIAMFWGCDSLISLDLSSFDTKNVTSMSLMFYDCKKLTSLNVSSFDTSKVTDMQYMFSGCYKLASLELDNFNTELVTNMSGMFRYCSTIETLDLSNFNTSNVTNMTQLFSDCKNLKSLNLDNFDTSKVTNMTQLFFDCENLTSLDLSKFKTDKVTNMSQMFYHCYKLKTLNLDGWNTEEVTNMSSMFAECYELTTLDISSFNTKSVTNMGGNYSDITDTGFTYSLRGMFGNCKKLKELVFGENFDTSKVTNLSGMFEGCSSLEKLDLSFFDTSSVENMNLMFYNTINLKELKLCSFNTKNTKHMIRMFDATTSLNYIYVGNDWVTNNADISYMFQNSSLSNVTAGEC